MGSASVYRASPEEISASGTALRVLEMRTQARISRPDTPRMRFSDASDTVRLPHALWAWLLQVHHGTSRYDMAGYASCRRADYIVW